MLHVILQILTVIGIVLLCVLGLLLLLLCLVLFVPVRYRLTGHREGEETVLSVRVTYLLHLLSARFDYPVPGSPVIKVCGIKIADGFRKTDRKAERESPAGDPEEPKQDTPLEPDAPHEPDVPSEPEAPKTAGPGGPGKEKKPPDTPEEKNTAQTAGQTEAASLQRETGNDREEKKKKQKKQKEKKQKQKKSPAALIREIIEKIKHTIVSICDKIKSSLRKADEIKETVLYYKGRLEDRNNRRFFIRVRKRVFKILKSIRPRVLRADLRIGTGSPDTTGYLCAVYGMLSPVLGNNVRLAADFENTVWEGSILLKGKITVCTILRHALCVVMDRQLRIFVKELKREEK